MSDIDLFSPLQLGPLTLKNRLVMAPLTRNRSSPEGVPHALNVEYYRQRASDPKVAFTRVVEPLNAFDLAYLHVTELGRGAEQGYTDYPFMS